MAQPYCTGAVFVFIGVTTDSAQYLGTCENFPTRSTKRNWDAVMNDVSGSKEPFDFAFEGQSALIGCVLTRWNESVLRFLDAQPNPITNTAGVESVLDQGALMATEGNTFHLWLLYAFATKAVAYPLQGAGKHYPQCILFGPDETESGSRPKKEHRMFYAWRQYDPAAGTFTLYDEGGLTSLPPVD